MATKSKETKSHMGKLITAVIITIAVIGGIYIARDVGGVDIPNSVSIEIPDGAGSSVVADMLYENGIIKHPDIFRICSKIGGYDGEYKPGILTIDSQMSYNDILDKLIVSERNSIKVTVPEGYTLKQIGALLEESGVCSEADFEAALDPSLYDYGFLDNLPQRTPQLEGYLFPATYEIMPGQTAKDIVNMMLETFSREFTDEFYARADELGWTTDQVITFASIIERETNADAERAKVAGVFYNRLNEGMNLQSCATVQYILGENKPVLSTADTQIDSPYNTYINKGLPIGPICSPGIECIKAVLYPEKTDAFYFLLGSDGKHIFSKTYEEHMKAMEENGL